MFDLARVDVCFLAGTLGQGGAERQLFYMLKTLRERGSRVRLLCLTSGEFWEDKLTGLGVPVEFVGGSPSRLARLAKIVQTLRRTKPQIVQSQHFFTNPYAAAAARVIHSRSIGAIRSDTWNEIHAGDETIRRWGLKLCRLIAANSAAAIRTAIEAGIPKNKLALLPNVVDTAEFRPAAPVPNGHAFTIAAVGRLVPSKRHDRLLSVAARLKNVCTVPVKILIAGDGPCRQDLQRRAEDLGLQESVQFLGKCDNLVPVYRAVQALAITSDFEGTPNVALEAMACGLPVVSTNVGGVPDVVRENVTGFLTGPEEDDRMAHNLRCLAENRELRDRMGASARAHMLENYSFERLPSYLEDLYAAALSN